MRHDARISECAAGGSHAQVGAPLQVLDAAAFRFDEEGVAWDGHRPSNAQLAGAREEFIVSFGSCSSEEPLQELRKQELS